MYEPSENYAPNLQFQPALGILVKGEFAGSKTRCLPPEFVVGWNCLKTGALWEEELKPQAALTTWPDVKHGDLNVEEAELEAAWEVVEMQKTDYEPKNLEV